MHNDLKTNTTVTMSRDNEMCPPEVTLTQGQGSIHSCPIANLFKTMFFSYCLEHALNYVLTIVHRTVSFRKRAPSLEAKDMYESHKHKSHVE